MTALIRPATQDLPGDLVLLAAEARSFGIKNVDTLITRWVDGTERYERNGESLLVAWSPDDVVLGVGGINWCPHVDGALRVRRFYVSSSARRQGIARRIAEQLISSGFEHTNLLTCNAGASAAAAPFWESVGFRRAAIAGGTHQRTLAPG